MKLLVFVFSLFDHVEWRNARVYTLSGNSNSPHPIPAHCIFYRNTPHVTSPHNISPHIASPHHTQHQLSTRLVSPHSTPHPIPHHTSQQPLRRHTIPYPTLLQPITHHPTSYHPISLRSNPLHLNSVHHITLLYHSPPHHIYLSSSFDCFHREMLDIKQVYESQTSGIPLCLRWITSTPWHRIARGLQLV